MKERPQYPDNWTWRERLSENFWMRWLRWDGNDWFHCCFLTFLSGVLFLFPLMLALDWFDLLPEHMHSPLPASHDWVVTNKQFVLEVENFSQRPVRAEGIHIHGNVIKSDITFLPKVSYRYVFSNGVLSHIVRGTEEKIVLERFTQWGTNVLEDVK